MATAVTVQTLREDNGLIDRTGDPLSAALTRYISRSVQLVEDYNSSANQLTKDTVINDLCANMIQNWIINDSSTDKRGRFKLLPTTLTKEMKNSLDGGFIAKAIARDDSEL